MATSIFVLTLLLQTAADPLSGTWVGKWGPTPTHRNAVTLELKWDGRTLRGTVNPGPNATRLVKTSFDAATGMVHFEADAISMGKTIHYVIDGKLNNGVLVGSWNHDTKKGDFKVAKNKGQ
jgi:hypothetical protein